MRSTWCLLSLALLVTAPMAMAQDSVLLGTELEQQDQEPYATHGAARKAQSRTQVKTTVEERLLPAIPVAPARGEKAPVADPVPNLGVAEYSAHPDRAAKPAASSRPLSTSTPAVWNTEPYSQSDPWVFDDTAPQYELVRTCRAQRADPLRLGSSDGASQSSSASATTAAPARGAKDNQTSRAKN